MDARRKLGLKPCQLTKGNISPGRLFYFSFLLIFRESPENMDFLEQKERKVPRYKHIFTRLLFSDYSPESVLLWFLLFSASKQKKTLKSPAYYPGEIWKRRSHFENESTVYRPPDAGNLWQRNNSQLFWAGKSHHYRNTKITKSKSKVWTVGLIVKIMKWMLRFQICPA